MPLLFVTSQTKDYIYRVVRNFVKIKKGNFLKVYEIKTFKDRDQKFNEHFHK